MRLGLVCPKSQDAEGVWTSGFLRYKSMLFGLLLRGIVRDGYNKSGFNKSVNFMM